MTKTETSKKIIEDIALAWAECCIEILRYLHTIHISCQRRYYYISLTDEGKTCDEAFEIAYNCPEHKLPDMPKDVKEWPKALRLEDHPHISLVNSHGNDKESKEGGT